MLGVVTRLAGGGSPSGVISGSIDGTVSVAMFSSPNGIAVSTSGTVYVADTSNNLIRMISPAGLVFRYLQWLYCLFVVCCDEDVFM